MPYYYYHEIKTPLRLFGIRLMKDDDGALWIKIRKRPRKMLKKSKRAKDD